jgi:hypothetical protein
MVKPPKTMQPEGMDLSKAGRTSRKSFGEDSFHLYMARKIDMQRQQFGVILPPPPLPSTPPKAPIEAANETKTLRTSPAKSLPSIRPHHHPTQPILRRKHSSTTKPPSLSSAASFSSPTQARPRNVVRFSPSTKRGEDDEERRNRKRKDKEKARQERESAYKRAGGDCSTMGSILERLQQRHGNGDSQHRARKKRKRVPGVLPRAAAPETRDFVPSLVSMASQHPKRSLLSSSFAMDPSTETVDVQSRHLHDSPDLDNKKNAHIATETLYVDEDTSSHQDVSITIENKESLQHQPTSSMTSPLPLLSLRRIRPDLFFMGVVIKINGYTDPDNETLKRLIQKHGGDFETYETTRVTHLIAGQLSKAKSDMYKKQRSPRPVCLPSWIVESVRAGRLLPLAEYGLNDMKHDPRQAGLSAFFERKEDKIGETQQQSRRIFGDYDEDEVTASTPSPSDKEKEPEPTTLDSSQNKAEKEGGVEEESSEAYITESDDSLVRQSHFMSGSTECMMGKQRYLPPSIRDDGATSIKSVEGNDIIDTRTESVSMTSGISIVEKELTSARQVNFATEEIDSSHRAINDAPEENCGLDYLPQSESEARNADECKRALAVVGGQNSDKELASDSLANPKRNRTEDKYINGKIRTTGRSLIHQDEIFDDIPHVVLSPRLLFQRYRSELFGFFLQRIQVEFYWQLQTKDDRGNRDKSDKGACRNHKIETLGISYRHGLFLCFCCASQFS